jgi:hypothetical protein
VSEVYLTGSSNRTDTQQLSVVDLYGDHGDSGAISHMVTGNGMNTRGSAYFAGLIRLYRCLCAEDAAVSEKAVERSQQRYCRCFRSHFIAALIEVVTACILLTRAYSYLNLAELTVWLAQC